MPLDTACFLVYNNLIEARQSPKGKTMAGNYYNGYTRTPRTIMQPKFRVAYTAIVVGGTVRRERTYANRAELDEQLEIFDRAGTVSGIVIERWKRGTGWVKEI